MNFHKFRWYIIITKASNFPQTYIHRFSIREISDLKAVGTYEDSGYRMIGTYKDLPIVLDKFENYIFIKFGDENSIHEFNSVSELDNFLENGELSLENLMNNI